MWTQKQKTVLTSCVGEQPITQKEKPERRVREGLHQELLWNAPMTEGLSCCKGFNWGFLLGQLGVQDIFLPYPVHFVVLFCVWASLLVSQLKWDTDRGFGTT